MASLLNPTSLLGVLDTRDEQEARESVTHLLYVATITDKEAARRFHKDAIEDLMQHGHSAVTGILLLQEKTLLHYYETPSEMSAAFLRHLGQYGGNGSHEKVRILFSSEDCHRRYFSDWKDSSPEVPDEGNVNLSTENPTDLSFDIFSKILKIAQEPKQAANLCPGGDRLAAICELDTFFSLTDYIEMFEEPISLVLDSERQWPIQPLVAYEGL